MNSRLYTCKVMHKRERPKHHRFTYPCFIFCIDLDEVDLLERQLTFFGYNKRNLYSLRDSDHLDESKGCTKENLKAFLRSKGVHQRVGRIELVTNLRTWGYVFNPVSFYFVYKPSGDVLCCVAEVANTFNEQKLYLIDRGCGDGNRFKQEHPKLFYISPFSDLATFLCFDLKVPDRSISLTITERDEEGTYFYSSLAGKSQPLTNSQLMYCTLRFPAMTLSIIARIHWQALVLALKKVPYFKKSHRPDLQTNTRTYLKSKKRRSA